MAEVTNEMLYRELLVLERQVAAVESLLAETLALLKLTAREGEQGRAMIEAAKAHYGIDRRIPQTQASFPRR